MKKIEIGAVYQHYKGTKVKVLCEVLHSETLEKMVVYVHLEDGGMWVRPTKMFLEKVEVKGQKVDRFGKIKQELVVKPRKK
jgi:hypothetical protein